MAREALLGLFSDNHAQTQVYSFSSLPSPVSPPVEYLAPSRQIWSVCQTLRLGCDRLEIHGETTLTGQSVNKRQVNINCGH